jgi:hypothetical protein
MPSVNRSNGPDGEGQEMIDELLEEKRRLLRTIELMKAKKLGVGSPITTSERINAATRSLIGTFEQAVQEIDRVVELMEQAQKMKARK